MTTDVSRIDFNLLKGRVEKLENIVGERQAEEKPKRYYRLRPFDEILIRLEDVGSNCIGMVSVHNKLPATVTSPEYVSCTIRANVFDCYYEAVYSDDRDEWIRELEAELTYANEKRRELRHELSRMTQSSEANFSELHRAWVRLDEEEEGRKKSSDRTEQLETERHEHKQAIEAARRDEREAILGIIRRAWFDTPDDSNAESAVELIERRIRARGEEGGQHAGTD